MMAMGAGAAVFTPAKSKCSGSIHQGAAEASRATVVSGTVEGSGTRGGEPLRHTAYGLYFLLYHNITISFKDQ